MKSIKLPHRTTSIAYDDAGSGEIVVLLHAFPLDRVMWMPQATALAERYRVLTLDFPGFGDTQPTDTPMTVELMADLVHEWLDAIGVTKPVVVGGLSMGGYVAMALARRHPERLRGLILADTKADADDAAAKTKRDEMIQFATDKGAAAVMDKMLPNLVADDASTTMPEVVEQIRAIGHRQSTAGVIAGLGALRDRPDANPTLSKIAVPTLVIVGEKDTVTPVAQAKKLQSSIPGATLTIIPGAGHLSNLEAPGAFTDAVTAFQVSLVH